MKNKIKKGPGIDAQIKSSKYKEIKTVDGFAESLNAIMKKEDIEKSKVGLRFDGGKIRHDLLEPFAINELAKVFTAGANKYSDNNWLKGMPWSKMLGCLKRHINAFERGEDFDPETGLLHMAHAAWNAMGIVSFYKHHPELDDRMHLYLSPRRIGLDIDEVIADWTGAYGKRFKTNGKPAHWNFDRSIGERLGSLKKDKNFWMDIEAKFEGKDINFEPVVYVTSRVIPTEWTEEWLNKHGFPAAPVVTVGHGESKLDALKKHNVDVFVDDSFSNFAELNKNGILCYLFDAPHNSKHDVGHKRIKSLKQI